MKQLKSWNKVFIEKNKYHVGNREIFYNLAFKYLPYNCNSTILDVGCGNGTFIKLLNQKFVFHNIFLLDGNIETINKLKKQYTNSLHYIIPEKLPFENSTIDYIHCSHVIEHLYYNQLYDFLKEINRILKDKGILIISTPLLWKPFYNTLTHIKPYHPSVLISYLCKISENLAFPQISENYSIEKLVYRYEHYTHFKEGLGSNVKIIDFFIQIYKKILEKLKIYEYNKCGYTLILRKNK